MPNFYSVFRHPDQGIIKYSCRGESLAHECSLATNEKGRGKHLYSTTYAKSPMLVGHRYKLRWVEFSKILTYRHSSHHFNGPSDYYRITEDNPTLTLEMTTWVPEISMSRRVAVNLRFGTYVGSSHFVEICNDFDCTVTIEDGNASMVFSRNHIAKYIYPLEIIQDECSPYLWVYPPDTDDEFDTK